jgi:carbohydrate kinase (thermoresistant glucokinase family)
VSADTGAGGAAQPDSRPSIVDDAGIKPCVLICMGVSGSGKSTIARLIDALLGWPFQEGDELHPQANIDKMSHHIPLTDEDRAPWLARCKEWIDGRIAADGKGLITCSALKRSYRDDLIAGRPDQVRILYLKASRELLMSRLARRQNHFMPSTLLDSQLATLEEPGPDENPIVIDVHQPSEEMTREVLSKLRGG